MSEGGLDLGVWSVGVTEEVTEWGSEFTEHWTLKFGDEGDVYYKLRVVGPNGEVCRDDHIPVEDAPEDVRKAFEKGLMEGGRSA